MKEGRKGGRKEGRNKKRKEAGDEGKKTMYGGEERRKVDRYRWRERERERV